MSNWLIAVVALIYFAVMVDRALHHQWGWAVMVAGWGIGCVGAIMIERGL